MRESVRRIGIALAALGLVLMLKPTPKRKPAAVVLAEADSCNLKSLSGAYGFSYSGYFHPDPNSGPLVVDFAPVAAGGTVTFSPDGNISRSFHVSVGPSIYFVNDSGSYVLNPNCTFTASVGGETWEMTPVEEGKQIDFFVNTPGRVGAAVLARK